MAIDKMDLIGYIIIYNNGGFTMQTDKEKGFIHSFIEGLGVLVAYCMVFYFLWEGLLAYLGIK